MTGVKVKAIAYVRLTAPDLDRMEDFLVQFGLTRAARTDDRLYMKAANGQRVHITELGEPAFRGFAFEVANFDDLETLAALPGATAVEPRAEPGGGWRVVLREPNGYAMEAVHGVEEDIISVSQPRQPMNTASEPLRRAGVLMRPEPGPASVVRIAHCVLATPKVDETVRWFRDTFGLIGSDDVFDDAGNLRMAFSRLDRDDDYVDHHVLFCPFNETAGLHHVSFEVADVDDLLLGHEHLKSLDRFKHVWGIGRHYLGSNIFDYWSDPWGRVHEHWSDTDRLNAQSGSNRHKLSDGVMRGIWGTSVPESFKGYVSP